MARIFLSHSSSDKGFVRRLAGDIRRLGHTVWLDEWEIRVGDSIPSKLGAGIEEADFVAVVLSKNSVSSGWVEQEWQAKYWDEVNKRKISVLPILLEDCDIPILLRPKKFADFRRDYLPGIIDLVLSVQPRGEHWGIVRYFPDFVDITDEWGELFSRSKTLDLLIMYGATWRNTYLKHIRHVLRQRGSRVRVVLPEVPDASPLLHLYAERLEKSPKGFQELVEAATADFKALARHGTVELYTTPRYMYHACYLFDAAAILALYSYRGRVSTPAFLLEEGALLEFVRQDFEWLVSPENPTRRML